jgi:long-chain acyl-CoA synthetase
MTTEPALHITPEFRDALTMFRATASLHPSRTLVTYFDAQLGFGVVDELSDSIAAALRDHGFADGDRLAVVAQNIPHTIVLLLAAWKAGGTIVVANPMLSVSELEDLLADAGPSVIAVEESRAGSWASRPGLRMPVISLCPRDWQSADDGRVMPPHVEPEPGLLPFAALLEEYRGRTPEPFTPEPSSPAAITYTSGTTGRAKGAVVRHESVAFVGQVYRDWVPLGPDDRILAISPLSSILALAVFVSSAFLTGCSLVLGYRFERNVLIDSIRRTEPTFLLGVPTMFTSLLSDPDLTARDLASLRYVYCGAAPTLPALVERWAERFGQSIRTVYGMTETSGPAIVAPVGEDIPVDAGTGALSIGIAVYDTEVRIVDPAAAWDHELPDGEVGELVVRGPQTIREYWGNPEATAATVRDGWVRTGDLMFRRDGWIYMVDRIKDIIITSGQNVSPSQVEDCLLHHPDVLEAAVIGVPDDYRGEAVQAIVVLRPGSSMDEDSLIRYCQERIARYKSPRRVSFVDALPKNANGKVLRRELRERMAAR